MKVSIITVCFNSEKTIENSIQSVLNQTYSNIEYIIIDGGSTDHTIDIIHKYTSHISKFISEPDKGIYDAMNKGLKLATGDIVAILNSDDFYIDISIIDSVVSYFKSNSTDSVYGDIIYVNKENVKKTVRYWKSKKFKLGSFQFGWHPPHPTFFVKNEVYKKYGYFNLEFQLAADFELMLRFIEKYKIATAYIPKAFVKMRTGGASNKSLKNIFNQNVECYRAFKINELKVSILYPIFRLAPKLLQFFK